MSSITEDPPLPPMDCVFPYLQSDPCTLPASLDPFTITTSTGFLPFKDPVVDLPPAFAPLTSLLKALPIVKADGTPGLLATYQLGSVIDSGALPDLALEIDNLLAEDGQPNLATITAAFRDYAFLASAYLLEPCWKKWNEDHNAGYGPGRDILPEEIAAPLIKAAAMYVLYPPLPSKVAPSALY